MTTTKAPGIKGLPVIGNLADYNREPFLYPNVIAPKHGRVVHLQLGPRDLYVVWHPEDIQRVLRDNHHNYRKGETAYPLEVVSGPALVNMEDEAWLSRRKQMQPYFHRKRVTAMLDLMQTAIDEQSGVLDRLAGSGAFVDLTPVFRQMTAHVFTKSFYGISLSEDEARAMSEAMYTLLTYVWPRYLTFGFLPEWMPYPNKSKFLAARKFLHEKSREFIQRRRAQGRGDDLLAMMMGLGEDDAVSFSDTEILQETVSLFQGGFDTSSGTLGWVFYMLAQHPEVAERLQVEIDTVLAGSTHACEVTQELTYTHQLIQETMRLYPSAAGVARLTVAEDVLGSYQIPSNAMVAVSFYAVHRHPEFWDEPDVFRPERFADAERPAFKHAFAYLPFASGPRMCIGDQFALYEMRLAIASLIKRYRFSLDPGYRLDASTASTYFPRHLPMRIEKR